MGTKTCTRCGIHRPDDANNFPARRGRPGGVCRDCVRTRHREWTRESRVNSTRDRAKEYAERKRKRAEANPQRELNAMRRKLVATLRRLRARRSAALPWNDRSLTDAQRYALRYKLDPEFVVSERLRRQVRKRARRDGVMELLRLAIKRGGRSRSAEALVGYSASELRTHLERQFLRGMTWSNRGEWHIDHIIPQKDFDLEDEAQWRSCWSLANLRPVWARENLTKGGRRTLLL